MTEWSRGIRSDDLSTGIAVAANLNSIAGNSVYGVLNGSTGQIIDAEDNWWGDSSGPSGAGSGSGDAVSTNVDFDPWLAAPPSACYDNTGPASAHQSRRRDRLLRLAVCSRLLRRLAGRGGNRCRSERVVRQEALDQVRTLLASWPFAGID
jgi:hypothetical protein